MHNKIYRMCHLIYPNMHLFNFSTLTITPSIFWTEHYDRLNACSGKLNGTCGKFYCAFNKCTLVLPNVYTDLPIYFFVCMLLKLAFQSGTTFGSIAKHYISV